ncbi:MAG: TA system VapC family ribonuclease toxin [Acidimicrobiales bacterium]
MGLPWPVIVAFVRISTNPRVFDQPLASEEAWGYVDDWLAPGVVWIPNPTSRHAEVFGSLVVEYHLRGEVVADAHLAALAIEHGLEVCSADTDFARFREIRWVNPLA